MAVDTLQIWNQALSALSHTERVAAPSEVSVEAQQCALWYETVRDGVFAAAPWTELTANARLAEIAARDNDEAWVATDPPPGWLFAHGVPSDYVHPRMLSSGAKFLPSVVGESRVIASNEETPILTYTRRVSNPQLWSIGLRHAVVFGLAAHISKAITGKDSDLNNMFTLAQEKIMAARASDANGEFNTTEHIPDWIAARGHSLAMPTTRYIYPSADFTVGGANNLG